jgi:endogenous inhibitor of DNA gyrase (YacG/DUF329 family)
MACHVCTRPVPAKYQRDGYRFCSAPCYDAAAAVWAAQLGMPRSTPPATERKG